MSGFVYAITHGGMTYFGSSQAIEKERWWHHKSDYQNDASVCSSKIIFLRADLDDELPTFIVLERYDYIDEIELKLIEQWYMDNFENVNKIRAITTKQHAANQQKERYEKNREEMLKKNRKRYEQNREKLLKQKKEYLEKNRDIINQRRRKRHAKKKLEKQSVVL